MIRAPRSGTATVMIGATLVVVAWAALYLMRAVGEAGESGFPLDDAWIHVRLARHMAAGSGLVFNPGEPGATSTAPLWSLVLAAAAVAGVPFPWAAYLAGCLATVGLAFAAALVLRRVTGDDLAAAAAALLVVSTHPFPWAAVSGMEASLAAAILVTTIGASAARRTVAALGLAVAGALVRPELAILIPLVGTGAIVRERARPGRAMPLAIGTGAAMALPWLANRLVAGAWIPASFAAKVGHHGVGAAILEGRPDAILSVVLENVPLYVTGTVRALWDDNPLILVLAIPGLVWLARAGAHLPWVVLAGLPVGVAILAPFGGPAFHEQRYLAPVVAVTILAGSAAIGGLARRLGRPIGIVAIVAAVAWSGVGAWRAMGRYGREVGNITDMQVRIARWLLERPGGPGLVATNDIGAIGAITGAPILDLTGLATPGVVPYLRRVPAPGERNRGWNGASETGILEYLRQRHPDYVALFPSWYPSPFFQEALGPPVLRVNLEVNVICGDRTMLVFRPDWNRPGGSAGDRR